MWCRSTRFFAEDGVQPFNVSASVGRRLLAGRGIGGAPYLLSRNSVSESVLKARRGSIPYLESVAGALECRQALGG